MTSVIKQKGQKAPEKPRNMMYGDIVIGLWWSCVVPLHGRDLWLLPSDDPMLPAARLVYVALVTGFILTWSAIITGKVMFSRLAMLANIAAMSATGYFEWPFPGECAITPMMVGGTVLGVLANFSLSFTEKMARLPFYFTAGSYVCIHSEYCDYHDDTRPILGGTVLLEMLILVVAHYGVVRKVFNHLDYVEFNVAHLARIVLACIFLHHVASTLIQIGDPNHGLNTNDIDGSKSPVAKQFFLMVQASLVAVVGVAATGAFQEEINSKERAEKKAKEESMMSKAMADSMTALTHELRTPLQGIMGATSMLLTNKSEKEDKDGESLRLIMASSGLLLNLINNMLDVKRVAEGMMEEFPLTLLPATEPIRDAIGFCLPLASISNVNIVQDYGEPTTEQAVVKSNALRLQQVLINLISNAIKYTNADGDSSSVIRVSLRSTTVEDVNWRMMRALASSRSISNTSPKNDGDKKKEENKDKWSQKKGSEKVLVFGVSDGGPGIDHVQANRLFRRFGRLDNKPKRTLGGNKVGQPSGTGLGLHLCELFVKRMDGQIWATNNHDGPGATFFFCLPLGLEKKVPTPEKVQLPRPTRSPVRVQSRRLQKHWGLRFDRRRGHVVEEKGSRDGSGKRLMFAPLLDDNSTSSIPALKDRISVFDRRVLIVDDTMINRKILDRMLKQIGVKKLVTVGSGQAALKELYKQRYDLLITDLQMPNMNGMELSEAIHEIDDEYFKTPVIVGLTADTSLETVEECKESGMADVIHKPITVEELRDFFERKISVLIEQNESGYLEA